MLDYEVKNIRDSNILYNIIIQELESQNNYRSIHWFLNNASCPAFSISLIKKLIENNYLNVDEISENYEDWTDDGIPTTFRVMVKELADYWNTDDLNEIYKYIQTIPINN